MTLWNYVRRRPAEKAWKKWLAWAGVWNLRDLRNQFSQFELYGIRRQLVEVAQVNLESAELNMQIATEI